MARRNVDSDQSKSVSREWRVVGTLHSTGQPAMLEWTNGALTGDPDTLRDVDTIVASGGNVPVPPIGPFLVADRYNEKSAFVMACTLMRHAEVTGDPPVIRFPRFPKGAIP